MQANPQTNREVLEALFSGDTFRTPEVEYQYRSNDFTAEVPQTGELFESREALRDMQREFDQPPAVSLKRITGEGDTWVVEATQTYEDQGDFHVCVIVEFADGKIAKETRYYCPPLTTDRS